MSCKCRKQFCYHCG